MKKINLRMTAMAFAVALASAGIVGCGEKTDSIGNERYEGVPKNGKSCEQFYQKPANVAQCVRQESQH